MFQRLIIDRLGQRGEGLASGRDGMVFVPYALPGDEIMASVEGERGAIVEIISPSAQRITPFCPHYSHCGGCAVQALEAGAYRAWKRGLVIGALERAGVAAEVRALIDAHGEGRRRATFHARIERDSLNRPRVRCGFMRARAHDIVDIDACPILAPALAKAPLAAREIARALAPLGKPLDITATATTAGLDVDFRGAGAMTDAVREALIECAARFDLARLSIHGEIIIERRTPRIALGRVTVIPPPGAFLQATAAGEEVLSSLIVQALDRQAPKAIRIADLFAGVGTFTFRIAERAMVHAIDSDPAAIAALERAASNAAGVKAIACQTRNLFRRPLDADELHIFDAVVIDPPRAGAEAQMRQLAQSRVRLVVCVSCNAQTFARDARILLDGGYALADVTPIDQFRHSPHVEMVGAFTRARRLGARRRLLG